MEGCFFDFAYIRDELLLRHIEECGFPLTPVSRVPRGHHLSHPALGPLEGEEWSQRPRLHQPHPPPQVPTTSTTITTTSRDSVTPDPESPHLSRPSSGSPEQESGLEPGPAVLPCPSSPAACAEAHSKYPPAHRCRLHAPPQDAVRDHLPARRPDEPRRAALQPGVHRRGAGGARRQGRVSGAPGEWSLTSRMGLYGA